MEVHAFFLTLLAILLGARILGELAAWLKMPPVIGELAAGVLLGPSLLGWVEPLPVIRLLAEIGIILLLFEVGLETDVMRLVKTGVKSAVVAVAGFVLPFAFGFSLSYWGFGQSLLVAMFIGGTLTATSIGITVRVLTDLNRHQCPEAQVVLGAAVLDDVMGVVLLAFLYEFSTGGGISLVNAGKVLLFVTLFMLLAPFAAKGMAEFVKRFRHMSQMEGLIPTFVVSLVLFFAWLAHAVGAPALLGGFAAGLALSRRFFFPLGISIRKDPAFAHRIEDRMKPIVQLFTPIFFVTVGLSLNFREVDWQSSFVWAFSLLLFVLAVGGKVLGAYLIKEGAHARFAIGMAMVPRGEVGLIFAELGRTSGLFDAQVYAVMVIVIALTTLLPPFVLRWFYGRYNACFIAA